MAATTLEKRFYEIRNSDAMGGFTPDRSMAAALLVLAETIKDVSCQTHGIEVKVTELPLGFTK